MKNASEDQQLGITRGNPWKVMGFSGVWPYLHNAVTNYLEIFITIGQYIWLWTHQFIKPYIEKCIQQKGKDIEKRTKIQNVGNVRFFLYLHLSVNSNLSFMTKKPKVSYSHTYCPAMIKFSRWLVTELWRYGQTPEKPMTFQGLPLVIPTSSP